MRFPLHKKIVSLIFVLMTLVSSPAALSQDTRTVLDPVFPTGCLHVPATKFIVSTTELNRDPFNDTATTPGYLGATGGTSFEPSSSESSYVAAESSDYTAVYTNGLAASPANHCVELVPSEGMYGFVMPPFKLPSGIWLVVDPGVTVFASLKAEDYDSGSGKCGTIFSGSSGISGGCNAWITSSNSTGSGIVGYGRLDARGWDTLSDRSPATSFYSNSSQAYCNIPSHHGPVNGSPGCTPTSNGSDSAYANPNAINLSAANDFTLYKITVTAGAGFQVKWSGVKGGAVTSGFTAVGFKLLVPFDISNTDGIDPTNNVTNFTVRDSYMSNGDDVFAIKSCDDDVSCSTSGPVTNGTIQNLHKYSGLGISIGAATGSNVSNIDINTVFCDGPHGGGSLNNHADTCIKLKSPSNGGSGGVVNNIKFRNIYIQNEGAAFRVYPFYDCAGAAPTFTNLLFQNITLGSTPGSVTVQGLDSSHQTTATFDNFVATASFGDPQTGCGNSGDLNVKYTLGPGPVDSTLISQLAAGSGSSLVADNRTDSATTYSATAQPLVGELVLQTASATNLQSLNTPAATSSYTLQAIVQPGSFVDTRESAPLPIGGSILFQDNGATIGTGSLGANGTMASLSLTDVAPGSHLYTATYAGDSNYPEYSFGAVVVTVTGTATNPTLVSAYLVGEGNANTIVTGGTLQIKAYGTFSDGSVSPLPDSQGSTVTGWNTSNHAVASISALGNATAAGTGSVNIEAMVGDIAAAPLAVTVTAALTPPTTPPTPPPTTPPTPPPTTPPTPPPTTPPTKPPTTPPTTPPATPPSPAVTSMFTVVASPASLLINAGSSRTTSLVITPVGGFTGALTVGCVSPSDLITCTVLQPAAISGSAPSAATVTIFVAEAAATSQTAGMRRSILIVGIAPLSALLLLPLANGRRRKLLCVLAVACLVWSITGCSNPSGKAIGASPISTEVLTLSAVARGVTITTQLTVTVN